MVCRSRLLGRPAPGPPPTHRPDRATQRLSPGNHSRRQPHGSRWSGHRASLRARSRDRPRRHHCNAAEITGETCTATEAGARAEAGTCEADRCACRGDRHGACHASRTRNACRIRDTGCAAEIDTDIRARSTTASNGIGAVNAASSAIAGREDLTAVSHPPSCRHPSSVRPSSALADDAIRSG